MERLFILIFSTCCVTLCHSSEAETVLSTVLTPDESKLNRQSRSYYDPRYGTGRPYDRLEYDRPSRCGRCLDDRDDRDDDYDRRRDRHDDRDDRRSNHRPTYGNRNDRNKGDGDDDDKRYNTDRNNNQKNGTDDDNDKDNKNQYDDKDRRPSGGRRDRDRDRDRNRYDDRDRYRPDYYDRFLRDRYDRDRYDRPYYDDPYRERRPSYDRYDDGYAGGYGGRYDGNGYGGNRRPAYDDRYDRIGAYDDSFGGYGPGVGRGPHDSFRPWDETYRGQAGWDAGGRGYYFASGRPDAAPAQAWGRPDYTRPQYSSDVGGQAGYGNTYAGGYTGGYTGYRDPLEYRGTVGYGDGGYRTDVNAGYGQSSGWRNVGERRPYRDQRYPSSVGNTGYRDPLEYRGTIKYGDDGYRTDVSLGYGQSSGWRDVGERRPYRDESGIPKLDDRGATNHPSRNQNSYGQNENSYDQNQNAYRQNQNGYGQSQKDYGQSQKDYGQSQNGYGQSQNGYGQSQKDYGQSQKDYGQSQNGYGQSQNGYGQSNRQPSSYDQNSRQPSSYGQSYGKNNGYTSSTTTQSTNYLFQREDERVTAKTDSEETTKTPS